jgi:hypothetical protein
MDMGMDMSMGIGLGEYGNMGKETHRVSVQDGRMHIDT